MTDTAKANEEYVVPEPDWSIPMFWEDITDLFLRFIDFIRSISRYF